MAFSFFFSDTNYLMVIQKRSPKFDMQIDDDDINDTNTLLNKEPVKRVLDWHEIPVWMQDNVYITGGYRRQTNSYQKCIESLFYLHNESGIVNWLCYCSYPFYSFVYS